MSCVDARPPRSWCIAARSSSMTASMPLTPLVTNRVSSSDAELLGDPPRPRRAVRPAGLGDLVADRVDDDAGVVAVLAHERLDVALPPLGEVQRMSRSRTCSRSTRRQFVHDEHAEPVAGVEHRPAHRVVRAAERVEPGLFQELDPALFCAGDGRRAEHAVVVVDARAAEFDRLAVDPQAASGVESQRADPEGNRLVLVEDVARRRAATR